MSGPLIIGLTGSIGMGKSTVAAMFEAAGVPIFDADAEVRALQGPDGELLPAIETEIPGSTGPNGLDRDMVGKIVFADPKALARLEAIIHPVVAARREAFLAHHTDAPLVLFDIPLLFEKGGHELVDQVVVVSAPANIQRERVLARVGMTPEKFTHILGLQVPDAEKRAKADYIIDTGCTLQETEEQVQRLTQQLKADLHKKP